MVGFRSLLLAVPALLLMLPAQAFDPALVPVFADRVVVKKAEHRLYLYKDDAPFAVYPIHLGRYPTGPKQRAGDARTPEGRYLLDWRKANSDFYRALHVSYPNAQDLRTARQSGVEPGGNIMIHGQPNWFGGDTHSSLPWDWTDGCIAVSNANIEMLWDLVPDGTSIDILP